MNRIEAIVLFALRQLGGSGGVCDVRKCIAVREGVEYPEHEIRDGLRDLEMDGLAVRSHLAPCCPEHDSWMLTGPA